MGKECLFNCTDKNVCSIIVRKGGQLLKEQLIKAIQRNQTINMIYLSKEGAISKRRVKIIKIGCDYFQAYCFTRRAKRTFIIDNVLTIVPVVYKERGII